MRPRAFAYGLGTAEDVWRRLARLCRSVDELALVTDDANQRDRVLSKRPAWARLTRRVSWQRLLLGRRPADAAGAGDIILIPSIADLGPAAWLMNCRSLPRVLSRGVRILIASTADGRPLVLSDSMPPDSQARRRAEAAAAYRDYHRRQTERGLAVAREAGKHFGRRFCDWPIVAGALLPSPSDLDVIRSICRRHAVGGETLKSIGLDLAKRGIRTSSGKPWSRLRVSRAYNYGVAQGWAPPKRRPWDLARKRLGMVTSYA